MSKQQLYINGVAVDMPTEEISIKVESNIFADAGNVMTAHSYSISIPRTMNNDAIFALAFVPSARTGGVSTHTYLSCSLYCDGIPLFEEGKCVVTSIDENGYQCNLYWGLLDVFNEIKREGLKLCDLPLSEHWNEDWGEWRTLLKDDNILEGYGYDSGMNQSIYDELDEDGKSLAMLHPWRSPSVEMSAIMKKIAQVYGINFTYSTKVWNEMVKLNHPLTSLKRKCDDEVITGQLKSADFDANNYYHDRTLGWSAEFTSNNPTILNSSVYVRFGGEAVDLIMSLGKLGFGEFHIYGNANHKFCVVFHAELVNSCKVTKGAQPILYNDVSKEWKVTKGAQPILYNDVSKEWKVDAADNGDGTWGIDINFINISFNGAFPHPVLVDGYWLNGKDTPAHDIKCDFELTSTDEARVGRLYSYVRNYPNVGIMDYIKEMMAHTGAFVVGSVTKPNSIHFVSIDEVVSASPKMYDALGVTTINMVLDKIGQKNIYLHKENEDDGLVYLADGAIYSSDETLEAEVIAFESKFKVPRNRYIKQWEIETITDVDESKENQPRYKAKWVNAGDYICGFDLAHFGIENTGQDFASLIAANYAEYSRILQHVKVVEAIVRLPILDLLDFDFTKPVYIPQLNSKFLVKSLESDNGDDYKLELVLI